MTRDSLSCMYVCKGNDNVCFTQVGRDMEGGGGEREKKEKRHLPPDRANLLFVCVCAVEL